MGGGWGQGNKEKIKVASDGEGGKAKRRGTGENKRVGRQLGRAREVEGGRGENSGNIHTNVIRQNQPLDVSLTSYFIT